MNSETRIIEYWSKTDLDEKKGDKILIIRKNYMLSGTVSNNFFDPKTLIYKYWVIINKVFAKNKRWEKKLKKLNIIH